MFALVSLLLVACGQPAEPVSLRFAATFGDQPLACDSAATEPALTDLRFFVHDVALLRQDGSAVPVALSPEGPWQSADVALVDLENGSGACLNGTPAVHATVEGEVPAGSYSGLRFALGVPARLNHADPLLAEAPLDRSTMHWHWRSGYKFMRAGYRSDDDGFWLHLGSARCHGTIGDLRGCDEPNRAHVELDGFDPARDLVAVDLAVLFESALHGDGVVQSCQMGPDESDCGPVQRALGLDPDTGESVAPATVFRAIRKP